MVSYFNHDFRRYIFKVIIKLVYKLIVIYQPISNIYLNDPEVRCYVFDLKKLSIKNRDWTNN